MIDLNNLPKNIDKQVFNATLNDIYTDNGKWQTWTKPSGASTAYIVCIGGGGGGGAGYSAPATGNRGGGSGGACSAVTIAQVPFYVIPDTLYISVGFGGRGAVAGISGAFFGEQSYVSLYPSYNMSDCLVISQSFINSSYGGNDGSTVGAPSSIASAALTSSATNNPRYLSLCNWASYAGPVSQAGTTNTNVSGFPIAQTSILTSGGGGAGCSSTASFVATGMASSDALTSFLKTVGASSTNNNNGRNGYSYLKPFLFVAGGGGSGIFNGTGGNGGDGNIGCGGGGGGGGVTGGNGGRGGNGLVMIISY